mgnify:CR=1 FL=1
MEMPANALRLIDGVWIASLTDDNFLRHSWCITLHTSNSYPTDMKNFHQSLNFVYFAYHMTDLLNFNSYFNHILTSVNSVRESISRR